MPIKYEDIQIQTLLLELPFLMDGPTGWDVYYENGDGHLQVEHFYRHDHAAELLRDKQDEAAKRDASEREALWQECHEAQAG